MRAEGEGDRVVDEDGLDIDIDEVLDEVSAAELNTGRGDGEGEVDDIGVVVGRMKADGMSDVLDKLSPENGDALLKVLSVRTQRV